MATPTITEDDLVKIFSDKKPSRFGLGIFSLLNKIIVLAILVCTVYVLINFNAFRIKFDFWFKNDIKGETQIDEASKTVASKQATEEAKKESLPEMKENSIKIPSLNIEAPIIWQVPNIPKDVSTALENGVIQIKGTGMPGERGNIYITGHSSNYVWSKGNYNNIFSLLGNLVAGDIVYVKFSNKVYAYKVINQKVVLPTDLSIMAPTDDSRLSLVTCWPVGTSLKRLVVQANQIFPDPGNNPPQKDVIDFKKMPAGR